MKITIDGANELWEVEIMDSGRKVVCKRHVVCNLAEDAGKAVLDQEKRKGETLFISSIKRVATIDLVVSQGKK